MAPTGCVVLDPRGVVVHVEGGAPSTWLGRTLEEAHAPSEVLRCARELLVTSASMPRSLDPTAATRPAESSPAREASGFFRRRTMNDGALELIVLEVIPLRRAHTPVVEIVTRIMDTFLQQASAARVELHVERDASVPASVFVDGEKVAWALGALVGNALRHATRSTTSAGRVDVHVSADTDTLFFVVEDTGPGIPTRTAKWLFSSDPATGRTSGTALRLVADVVAAHRGKIDASNAPAGGARFTMRLPRH